MYQLLLASQSPRRRAFLQALGLSFQVQQADIDETPQPGEAPLALVQRLSLEKAQAISPPPKPTLIIAADTIVVLDEDILGKPATPAEATAMLQRLRGRSHAVISSLTLLPHAPDTDTANRPNIAPWTAHYRTAVTMRSYTEAEIQRYVASGDPMDKAGAYAIQHPNFAPVARLDGCYASVVGLPLAELKQGLTQFNISLPQAIPQACPGFQGQACCVIA